jgi:hypothetical protein
VVPVCPAAIEVSAEAVEPLPRRLPRRRPVGVVPVVVSDVLALAWLPADMSVFALPDISAGVFAFLVLLRRVPRLLLLRLPDVLLFDVVELCISLFWLSCAKTTTSAPANAIERTNTTRNAKLRLLLLLLILTNVSFYM